MRSLRISVITVCYNAVADIEKTILSVVNQRYNNIEYIIIDGGSNDGTVDLIDKYDNKINRWISEKDQGIYDAMNKGIIMATGDYVLFLNAGDQFHDSECVSLFINQIAKDTTIAYGLVNFQYSIAEKVRHPYSLEEMNRRMPIFHPATFVKVSYHKNHLFDTSYRSSGDYDFLYKAYNKDKVKFQYIPVVVSDFEAEAGISSSNYALRIKEDARVKGKDSSLSWKVLYIAKVSIYNVKQYIKKVIPDSYLEKRKREWIEHLQ